LAGPVLLSAPVRGRLDKLRRMCYYTWAGPVRARLRSALLGCP
jgi:hypothetical protein